MASILKARGYHKIVDVQKGWRAIETADVPKTDYTCPTTITQEVIDAAVASVV